MKSQPGEPLWRTVLVWALIAVAGVALIGANAGVTVELGVRLLAGSLAAGAAILISQRLFRARPRHWDVWAAVTMGGLMGVAGLIFFRNVFALIPAVSMGVFWWWIMQEWRRRAERQPPASEV